MTILCHVISLYMYYLNWVHETSKMSFGKSWWYVAKLWLFLVACKQNVKNFQIWMVPLHFEFHWLLSAQWWYFTGNLILSNNIIFHVVPIITVYTEVCISSHYSGLWVFTVSFQLLNPQLPVHWFKNLMNTNRKCQESGFVCMSLYKLL